MIALDLPTGLDATTGEMHARTRADVTFTYGSLKRGHLIARAACGRIVVLDIGLGVHGAVSPVRSGTRAGQANCSPVGGIIANPAILPLGDGKAPVP